MKGLHCEPQFLHKDEKEVWSPAGPMAGWWIPMASMQCSPAPAAPAHLISLAALSHPSSAGTTALPEHPQLCAEATQPFT